MAFKISNALVKAVMFRGTTVNKVNYKGVQIFPEVSEPNDDDVEWSVDFIQKDDGRNETDLSTILTPEQMADITDENCAGVPDYDGNNRLIAVYFLGTDERDMPEPYLLPWAEDTGKIPSLIADMAAAGYNEMTGPVGGYYLDEAGSLQLNTMVPFKMRIEKRKTPFSNN